MSTTFLTPEQILVVGELEKATLLTPEKHSVRKPVYIFIVNDKGVPTKVAASPEFLPGALDVPEEEVGAEVKQMLGQPVKFQCEVHIENKTGYTTKDGKVVLHERDGIALRNRFHMSEMRKKTVEAASIGRDSGIEGQALVDMMLAMMRPAVTV